MFTLAFEIFEVLCSGFVQAKAAEHTINTNAL
jgi:hypothetical protein